MAWHKQADGTGRDDHGHACGQGMMHEIETKGISANGTRSETYMGGLEPVGAFLPLENGQILTWDGHSVGYDGTHVVEGLLRAVAARDSSISDLKAQLAAAQSAPHADPLAAEALDVMQRQSALFAKLVTNAVKVGA